LNLKESNLQKTRHLTLSLMLKLNNLVCFLIPKCEKHRAEHIKTSITIPEIWVPFFWSFG
jgi:hypothetical protein